jgi:hypothetical protein
MGALAIPELRIERAAVGAVARSLAGAMGLLMPSGNGFGLF